MNIPPQFFTTRQPGGLRWWVDYVIWGVTGYCHHGGRKFGKTYWCDLAMKIEFDHVWGNDDWEEAEAVEFPKMKDKE